MGTYVTIDSAIRAALELDQSGVGVALPDQPHTDQSTFVQWVPDWSRKGVFRSRPRVFRGLDRVEVCFDRRNADVARQLEERGFAPDPDLDDVGIWAPKDPRRIPVSTEEELVGYVGDLLRVLGARDGMELTAYP